MFMCQDSRGRLNGEALPWAGIKLYMGMPFIPDEKWDTSITGKNNFRARFWGEHLLCIISSTLSVTVQGEIVPCVSSSVVVFLLLSLS